MAFGTSASAFAVVLLCICLPGSMQQSLLAAAPKLAPGIIPIPDDPPATAPAVTVAPATALPAAAPAAAAGALPAAQPAAVAPAGYPAAAPATAAFPAALPAAAPAAAYPATTLPGTAAVPDATLPVTALPAAAPAAFPGALPAAGALPTAPVGLPTAPVGLPTAPGALPAAPGALPGAITVGGLPGVGPAGAAGVGLPVLPAGALPGFGPRLMAPPPRARSASPPAPPIPAGGKFTPTWDALKDLGPGDLVVSVNVANTPEQVYWGQKGFRETLAKTAQVRSSSVYYKDVLPNMDDAGNALSTVRFVVTGRNPDAAQLTQANLGEKGETTLKNKVEEFGIDVIGDTLKAQTAEEFKATAQEGGGPLPSAMLGMDTSGGMNGAGLGGPGAAAGPGVGVGGPMDTAAAPGALPGSAAGGLGANATGLGGLPGAGGAAGLGGTPGAPAGGVSMAARRAAMNGAGQTAAPAVVSLLLAAVAALAML